MAVPLAVDVRDSTAGSMGTGSQISEKRVMIFQTGELLFRYRIAVV